MEQKNTPGRKRREFFEDYVTEQVPRPRGLGTRTVRVYAGDYHCQSLTRTQGRWLRALYAGLFFVSLGLMLLAASRPVYSNLFTPVGITQMLALAAYAWVLAAFVVYIPTGRRFTSGEYRSGPLALRRATLATALALCAVALCVLVYWLANLGTGYTGGEGLSILLNLLAAAAVSAINRIERRLPYTVRPSTRKARTTGTAAAGEEDA